MFVAPCTAIIPKVSELRNSFTVADIIIIYSLRCIERSRMKCIQYWPENHETQEFATIDVSHEETLEFEDHIERVFWMKHKRVRNQYPCLIYIFIFKIICKLQTNYLEISSLISLL